MSTTATVNKATFAAGCFWGVEKYFRIQFPHGLLRTRVGYTGGGPLSQIPSNTTTSTSNNGNGNLKVPTYEEVCTGRTGLAEALEIEYDPSLIKYEDLVRFFFRMHDPTTVNQQGPDIGSQYRSAIYTHTATQRTIATQIINQIQKDLDSDSEKRREWGWKGVRIVTEVEEAGLFWEGEGYHQRYLERNPYGYCSHKVRS